MFDVCCCTAFGDWKGQDVADELGMDVEKLFDTQVLGVDVCTIFQQQDDSIYKETSDDGDDDEADDGRVALKEMIHTVRCATSASRELLFNGHLSLLQEVPASSG